MTQLQICWCKWHTDLLMYVPYKFADVTHRFVDIDIWHIDIWHNYRFVKWHIDLFIAYICWYKWHIDLFMTHRFVDVSDTQIYWCTHDYLSQELFRRSSIALTALPPCELQWSSPHAPTCWWCGFSLQTHTCIQHWEQVKSVVYMYTHLLWFSEAHSGYVCKLQLVSVSATTQITTIHHLWNFMF